MKTRQRISPEEAIAKAKQNPGNLAPFLEKCESSLQQVKNLNKAKNNASIDMRVKVLSLKESPMFNLSLASKELFHSNLLAWVAEDQDLTELFVSILVLFGVGKNWAEDLASGIRGGRYIVLREYKNFDFCICEKLTYGNGSCHDDPILGQVLLVLENKFKSIPYEKQLKEYQKRIKALNEEGWKNAVKSQYAKTYTKDNVRWSSPIKGYGEKNVTKADCHFVLLSLAKTVGGLSVAGSQLNIGSTVWHFIQYQDYAQTIIDNLPSIKNQFKKDVIDDYAHYVKIFCEYLNQELPSDIGTQQWTSILSSRKELKDIRMDDIWQKLIANYIAVEFCRKCTWSCVFGNDAKTLINDPIFNNVHVGAGYTRGSGLFEVKIKINDICLFGIQIQGGYYKRLLETSERNAKKTFYERRLSNLGGLFEYGTSKWENPVDIFDTKGDIYPKKGKANVLDGFGGFGKTFVCQSKKLNGQCTVYDVLDAVIKDVIRACEQCKVNLPKNRFA